MNPFLIPTDIIRAMSNLVLASHNAGKLAEMRALLAPLGWTLHSLADYTSEAADETAPTFVENALLKARHAARASGLPALADDSGLEVDALDGAPGVYSARYAGEPVSDEANNCKLLAALADVSEARRGARFVSVLVLLRHPEDPTPLVAQGEWRGRILHAPRGENGFGYDPLFLDPASGLSAAELAPADKNARSHRAQAIAALLALLVRREL